MLREQRHTTGNHGKTSVARPLVIATVIFGIVVTLLTTAIQFYLDYRREVDAIHFQFEQIRSGHLKSVAASVFALDEKLLQLQLDGLLQMPNMEYLAIRVDGAVEWSAGEPVHANTVSAEYPLVFRHQGETMQLGTLHVVASKDAIHDQIVQKAVSILGSIAVLIFLVAGFLFFLFRRLVTRHLEALAQYTTTISFERQSPEFTLDRPASSSRQVDELEQVSNAINTMRSKLAISIMDLRDSEKRFRDFANAASDWFWEMDADLRFTYFSDRAFEIMKADLRGVIGKTRKEIAGTAQIEADPEKWHSHFDDLEAHRPFRGFDYSFIGTDGVERSLSTSGLPVFDDDGVFHGYRGTGTDITELKKAEAVMREAVEYANVANRSKTEFLANMSHELRTPLNSINGFSELLEREYFGSLGSDKNREYVSDIRRSSMHLLRLISDILDVSKIEAGAVELDEEEVDIGETIDVCLAMMKTRSNDAGVSLSANTSDGCPSVRADSTAVKQILLNLLSNAIKFTPTGGEVAVTAFFDGNGASVLRVVDNGIGIAAGDIPTILEPFTQVGDIMIRNHEGTGLGLSLSKSLVELHGGTLDLESAPGAGTTVTVRFPPERTIAG